GKCLEGQPGTGTGGETERRAGEAELQDRLSAGAGVEQEVLAGDADVELTGAHIDRDVTGPEEEELGVVLGVDEDELAVLGALAITGFGEHLAGGPGEDPLVRDGDTERHETFFWRRDSSGGAYRCRYTSASAMPRPSISTWMRYSSWLISSAVRSADSCSAA